MKKADIFFLLALLSGIVGVVGVNHASRKLANISLVAMTIFLLATYVAAVMSHKQKSAP